MNPEHNLEVSLRIIEELLNLIEGNEYQQFLSQHLISIQVELQRQLLNWHTKSKI